MPRPTGDYVKTDIEDGLKRDISNAIEFYADDMKSYEN